MDLIIPFVMTFDRIRATTKEDFLDMLAQDGRVSCVYCGEDFRYGFQGQGDVAHLRAYCAAHPALSAVVVPTVSMFGKSGFQHAHSRCAIAP